MDWIRGILGAGNFSCPGSFVKFVSSSDNYAKITLFMNATLEYGKSVLMIKNDDFDPDQDQLPHYEFPVRDEMYFTHYSYSDDEEMIFGLKWKTLTQESEFFGFEFENPSHFEQLRQKMPASVEIEEEGYQHPSDKIPADPNALRNLSANTAPPSNLNKVNIPPEPLLAEEESKHFSDLNFKKAVIDSLEGTFSPNQILFVSAASLSLLDVRANTKSLIETGLGFLLVKHTDYIFSFDIVRGSEIAMRSLITPEFQFEVNIASQTVVWVEVLEQRCWEVLLAEDLSILNEMCKMVQYESSKKQPFEILDESDRQWISGMPEAEETGPDPLMDLDWGESYQQEEEVPIYDSTQSQLQPLAAVSMAAKLKLFSIGENSMDFRQEFPIVNSMRPYSLMLHRQDQNLLMLDQSDRKKIFCLDMNRGSIVEEWTADGVSDIHTIVPLSKFSSKTPEQSFAALSEKTVFNLDPRIGKQEKDTGMKTNYTKNPHLTCMATSSNGHAAVGAKGGEIKLFTQIGKRAKTSLPGLGDPVISVDVTKTGDWVLATCEKYLIVIPTVSHGVNGFVKGLGKHKRVPHKLTLKPQHIVQYDIKNLKFTPAKFNVNEDSQETAIISSVGKIMVIWDFQSVKRGYYQKYAIKVLDDSVIKNEFKFGVDDTIITHSKKMQFQRNKVRFHGNN